MAKIAETRLHGRKNGAVAADQDQVHDVIDHGGQTSTTAAIRCTVPRNANLVSHISIGRAHHDSGNLSANPGDHKNGKTRNHQPMGDPEMKIHAFHFFAAISLRRIARAL